MRGLGGGGGGGVIGEGLPLAARVVMSRSAGFTAGVLPRDVIRIVVGRGWMLSGSRGARGVSGGEAGLAGGPVRGIRQVECRGAATGDNVARSVGD